MLKDYYFHNVYQKIDLNCAESVLYTADQVYEMGLSHESRRLSSPFGGGMFIEEKCGAVTGALMALGVLFVDENAHAADHLKEIVQDYFSSFEKELGSCECSCLKETHRSEEYGCRDVVVSALDILESTVDKFTEFRVR